MGGYSVNIMKRIQYAMICLLSMLLCPLLAAELRAEFYKYVDKDGKVYYVDDLSKIPEEYRQNVNVYPERYDHLSNEEKARALERERRQIEEQQRQLEEQLESVRKLEEAEKRKQAQEARQKLLEKTETKIIIDGNRILVPVILNNQGTDVDANLLLDTGASQIVVFRSVAEQLNIVALKKGRAQVAGGQHIYAEVGQISAFTVGPYTMKDVTVLIIAHEGEAVNYNGLLGMNFLKNVSYTIDYKNQLIRWKLPEGEEAPDN